MPVDNQMFTSQPTPPLWQGAPRWKPSNSFDLRTGLYSVFLLRKHQEMFAETGGQINAVQVHCLFLHQGSTWKTVSSPTPNALYRGCNCFLCTEDWCEVAALFIKRNRLNMRHRSEHRSTVRFRNVFVMGLAVTLHDYIIIIMEFYVSQSQMQLRHTHLLLELLWQGMST